MYLEHFGLDEPPFRITPHTDFFFDGADRGTTLEALLYAILHDEGIVKVSGEVGSGKTMLCRVLMERLPETAETIYVATPSQGRDEILFTIADDLNLQFSEGRVTLALRELQEELIRLYGEGRRVVILIDEAHAMPEETLEQVRLLSNLESNRHKLLQIALFGQPELDLMLAKPSMRQLKDRITHSFRMRALNAGEVATYLTFRMRAAGYRGPDVFTPAATRLIARATSGLSRRINILADKSLLSAFVDNVHAVTPKQVRVAINDSEFAPVARAKSPLLVGGLALVAGVALGVAIPWFLSNQEASLAGPLFSGPTAPTSTSHAPVTRLPPPPAPVSAAPAVVQAGAAPFATPAVPPGGLQSASGAPALPREATAGPAAPPPDPSAVSAPPPVPLRMAQADARRMEIPESGSALLGPEQLKHISSYPTGNARLLRDRIAATRKALTHEPDNAHSIELFLTTNGDAARMERFLVRARELVPLSQVYVLPELSGRRYQIRVLFGIFPDREAATFAEKRLPQRYQRAFQTVPRSFAELRANL